MKDFMNMAIIDVIREYPEVGIILEENGVGCVTCSVGTCLLKDVMKIHYMPERQSHEVMKKIEMIISEDEIDATGNDIQRVMAIQSENQSQMAATMNVAGENVENMEKMENPLHELVEEHIYIKKVLAIIPEVCISFQEKRKVDILLLNEIVGFIKNYADKYHHAKEEEILFRYAPEGFAPIKAMLEEHEIGRNFVKSALLASDQGNVDGTVESLLGYMKLLEAHISREDTVLYPWFARTMGENSMKKLEEKFKAANNSFGIGYGSDYESWADKIHEEIKLASVRTTEYINTDEKLIEKLIKHEGVEINHMVLPGGETIPGHETANDIFFIILRGEISVQLNNEKWRKYRSGQIVELPKGIRMELKNEGTETYEMFIVRVPNK